MANDFEMVPVTSSQLAEVGYDEETRTMQVRFTKGQLYTYSGVPQEEYEALIGAESVGSYFNQNVKWKYAYTRLG